MENNCASPKPSLQGLISSTGVVGMWKSEEGDDFLGRRLTKLRISSNGVFGSWKEKKREMSG